MVEAMDKKVWERNRKRLGGGRTSRKKLRMASGQIVNSGAVWKGTVEVEGLCIQGTFEVLDSGGGWDFLFGKRLQTAFSAVHDYKRDTVDIEVGGGKVTLENQQGGPWWESFKPPEADEMRATATGAVSFANAPMRAVQPNFKPDRASADKQNPLATIEEDTEGERQAESEDHKPTSGRPEGESKTAGTYSADTCREKPPDSSLKPNTPAVHLNKPGTKGENRQKGTGKAQEDGITLQTGKTTTTTAGEKPTESFLLTESTADTRCKCHRTRRFA